MYIGYYTPCIDNNRARFEYHSWLNDPGPILDLEYNARLGRSLIFSISPCILIYVGSAPCINLRTYLIPVHWCRWRGGEFCRFYIWNKKFTLLDGIYVLISIHPDLHRTKELSLGHTLKFANPYIFATWCKPLIFQT